MDTGLKSRLQLYVVTDERSDVRSLLSVVRQAILGGATAIQLRRKHDDGRQLVEIGREIRQVTAELGALYIVNDRVDVALLTDADGVHVGQTDVSCEDVRRLVGDKIIGISAANRQDAIDAERAGADYVGVGSIFPTGSKSDAEVCGLAELREICRAISIPTVAIGGIALSNSAEVIACGTNGIAVVSAVMSADNPKQAAQELFGQCQARL